MNVYKQTPTPNETSALINEALTRFESVLDTVNEKKGYLMAKKKCPNICNDAFKLIFLRCEVFNVDRAVNRFVKYWDTRVEVFGEERAFLEMTLDGAMKDQDDKNALQSQYIQLATETDPTGRAILLFDFKKEAGDASSDSLLRAFWYKVHEALSLESCQKHGVVVYAQCVDKLSDWRPSLTTKIAKAGKGILPMRFAGMHIIRPPTFISAVLNMLVKPLMGKKLRHRFYSHTGSNKDLLESLSKFELGTEEMLPVNFGGKLMFI